MKINVDVPSQRVTVGGVSRAVVGLMPEYADIELIEFDAATGEGVITHKSKALAPTRITSIATLQSAISCWRDARPSHASVWLDIKAKRADMKAGGVRVGADWFFTDPDSVSQYAVMYAAIAVNNLPNAYVFAQEWKTMRGNKVPMTAALLKSVVGLGMRNETANFSNAEKHKAAMLATQNPGSYDFSAGWTEVYA